MSKTSFTCLPLSRDASKRQYIVRFNIGGEKGDRITATISDRLLSMLPLSGKSYLPEQLDTYVGKLSLHYLLHKFNQFSEIPERIELKTDGFSKGYDYLVSRLGISDLNRLPDYDCVSAGSSDCPKDITDPKEGCLPGIAECWIWVWRVTKR